MNREEHCSTVATWRWVALTLALLGVLPAAALAAVRGDFNGDGYADLAIGAPREDFQGQPNAGVVHVLYGSSAGLQATGVGGPAAQLWSQASPGVADAVEENDQFGSTLAVGDFNGDGFADLAIAAPLEGLQGQERAGVVHILYGSSTGLQAIGVVGRPAQLWSQASPGVAGGPEFLDHFGSTLAVGDFNGDDRADLAIGVPFEDFQGQFDAGVVHILYGTFAGLRASGVGGLPAQLWSQATADARGAVEPDDYFGWALASQ